MVEKMTIRVLKFGGTSVANSSAISRVVDIVANSTHCSVIVVSACSQITNKLVLIIQYLEKGDSQYKELIKTIKSHHLGIVNELYLSDEVQQFVESSIFRLETVCDALFIIKEISDKFKDEILSLGEQLSSKIVTNALSNQMCNVFHVEANRLIVTEQEYNQNKVNLKNTQINIDQNLKPLLKKQNKVVMAGFIAANNKKQITTLGRGGSDYSAALIASCIQADAIEIWTDVDGILTADPTKVSDPKLVSSLSFQEAAELAYFGAKVLHPKTLGPAKRKNIPVIVKNTFAPINQGSTIDKSELENQVIKSIASRKNITVISIQSNHMFGAFGFLKRVFEVFDKYQCSVDVVTTSEVSLSITIDDVSRLEMMTNELSAFSTIEIKKNQAIIAIVGEGLKQTSGVAAQFFTAIKDINVSMISLGASEVNLTIVVDDEHEKAVVQKLHQHFFS